MDIMMPDLDHQSAPAPWLVHHNYLDVAAFVRAALARNPDATAQQVIDQLSKGNVDAPGTIIASLVAKLKAHG